MNIPAIASGNASIQLTDLAGTQQIDSTNLDFALVLAGQFGVTQDVPPLAIPLDADLAFPRVVISDSSAKSTQEDTETPIGLDIPFAITEQPAIPLGLIPAGQGPSTNTLPKPDDLEGRANLARVEFGVFNDKNRQPLGAPEQPGQPIQVNLDSKGVMPIAGNASKTVPPPFAEFPKALVGQSTPTQLPPTTASLATNIEAANLAVDSDISGEAPPPTTNISNVPTSTSFQSPINNGNNIERIHTHLHSPQWPQSLGDKVVWLAKNEQQIAQISINPPQLGPMQITLNLQGDQATAAFVSAHPEVRQAIEDAMPRLREMLSSAGITLGGTNVGAQLPQQRDQQPTPSSENRSHGETAILRGIDEGASQGNHLPVNRGRGLVDLFA
jgi:Flagellar hook-length control protein FliK